MAQGKKGDLPGEYEILVILILEGEAILGVIMAGHYVIDNPFRVRVCNLQLDHITPLCSN